MMYTLGVWIWIFYDENHHPLLLVFIFASALVATGAAWVFLRSSSLKNRILSITVGFIFGKTLSDISYATWDYRSYYELPESIQTWYQSIGITIAIMAFWFGIFFGPLSLPGSNGLLATKSHNIHQLENQNATISSLMVAFIIIENQKINSPLARKFLP